MICAVCKDRDSKWTILPAWWSEIKNETKGVWPIMLCDQCLMLARMNPKNKIMGYWKTPYGQKKGGF